MDDFDSPLDLDGDGDDAIEMCLFFDEDGKKRGGGNQQPGSGCGVALLLFSGSVASLIWGIAEVLI